VGLSRLLGGASWGGRSLKGSAAACLLLLAASSQAGEWTGEIAIEGRVFPQEALEPGLQRANVSASAEPEFYHEWGDGKQTFEFEGFARYDQHDSRRTHVDLRQLLWSYDSDWWEVRAGVGRVFWGVTESNHLVDVINQTDFVENLDGEDKLGQPMINFALIQSWGTVDFFVLPGFRERTFFGPEGRPGLPIPIDLDNPFYESERGRGHVDWAVRWSHSVGLFDFGASHFKGTSRDPRFLLRPAAGGESILTPFYELIDQTGADVQLTQGAWLWKLELIHRRSDRDSFTAVTGGFEYTFSNIRDKGLDVGVLVEYSRDPRGVEMLTVFDDDIFSGVRLAFNDVQSTEILAGAAVDRNTGAMFVNVEGSRRFGSSFTLDIQMRAFVNASPENVVVWALRKDSYLEARWAWHF